MRSIRDDTAAITIRWPVVVNRRWASSSALTPDESMYLSPLRCPLRRAGDPRSAGVVPLVPAIAPARVNAHRHPPTPNMRPVVRSGPSIHVVSRSFIILFLILLLRGLLDG
jgi:hypothetical protein